MALPAVLTYFQSEIQGSSIAIDDIALRPAPKRIALQNVMTQLFIWPRLVTEERQTMAGKHGYRNLHYVPMDFTLRQTVGADSDSWLAFAALVAQLQAFLRSKGDIVPIPITDSLTNEDTYITRIHEQSRSDYSYAPVLRQDAPVTTQVIVSVPVDEYMQGPGIVP